VDEQQQQSQQTQQRKGPLLHATVNVPAVHVVVEQKKDSSMLVLTTLSFQRDPA
jgi:hypothetical protein